MKWTKAILPAVVAALIVASASTAWADEVHLEIRGMSMETPDAGYTNLTGDASASSTGFALGYSPSQIDGLRFMASMDVNEFQGTRFAGDLDAEWLGQRFMGGVDYGIDLFDDRLRPLVRVGVGYSRQELIYRADRVSYRDSSHGLTGQAAAGLEGAVLLSDPSPESIADRLSLRLSLTAGYSWRSSANFDEMTSQDAPEEPDDDDPWQRATYDAGTIGLSGFSMAFGVMLGYSF